MASTAAPARDLSAPPDSREGPDWWRQAVVYQIYPRSFADANGDGIGDLPGITSRVDYLAALGVDAVWLSPFYPSALADGGYDVADYRDVDPRLGTLADFDAMVAALHAAGIRVVVDIVPEPHVESARVVPGGARGARRVRRRGIATSSATGPAPTARSRRPTGSRSSAARRGSRSPDGQWYLHFFAVEQPDLNWENPEVREDFVRTLRFWSDRGVDGFRIDVAHMLTKDLTEPLPSKAELDAMPHGRQPPGHRPRRRARHLRRVAGGVQRVRPAAHRGRRGLGGARAAPALRERGGPRPGVQLRPARGGLRCRAVPAHRRRQPRARRAVRLVDDVGALEPRRRAARDAVRPAAPGARLRTASPTRKHGNEWLLSRRDEPGARSRSGHPPRARGDALRARAARVGLPLPGRGARPARGRRARRRRPAGSDVLPQPRDSTWGGTDAACRCRGAAPATSFGFGADGAHLPQPDWFGALAVEAAGSRIPARCCRSTGARSNCGAGCRPPKQLEWVDTGRDDVLWFRRPGGWEVVTNFGAEPFPLDLRRCGARQLAG